MKIAAIQGYIGKEYKPNFRKKGENVKVDDRVSPAYSSKASILKMLPVMLAMAGMQPAVASTALEPELPQYSIQNPPSPPKVYPKSDSRYDPQYDGESKYLHLNLNELYFYAFNSQRTPKFIDMNELFDTYMEQDIDWKKLKRGFNFSSIDISNIQTGIDYFETLYKLKQIRRQSAIARGEPDPYSPEVLSKRNRLRPHYRQSDILGTYIALNSSNAYTTQAMQEATTNPPGYVDGILAMEMKDFRENYPELAENINYDKNRQELEYKGMTNINSTGMGELISAANTQIETLASVNEYYAQKNAEVGKEHVDNNKPINNSKDNEISKSSNVSKEDFIPETVVSDSSISSIEANFMKDVYTDLQKLLYGQNIDKKNSEILEKSKDGMKLKVKTDNFSALLNMTSVDENSAYVSGVLESSAGSDDPGRKMEFLAMSYGDGSLYYALFKDLNTNKAYSAVIEADKELSLFDFTKEASEVNLEEFASILEENAEELKMYESTEDTAPEDDLSYFAEVAALDRRNEIRHKTYHEAMQLEDYYSLDSVENIIAEEEILAEGDYQSDINDTNSQIQTEKVDYAAMIEFAEKLAAEKEKDTNDESPSLPLILTLTAVGGAAAGIGGKKVFESLKAKNINFKDVMDKVKQKLASTHSTTQTFKKKNMNVDDPKKAFWG